MEAKIIILLFFLTPIIGVITMIYFDDKKELREKEILYPRETGYKIKIPLWDFKERQRIFREEIFPSYVLFRREIRNFPIQVFEVFYRPKSGTGVIHTIENPTSIKFSLLVEGSLFWDCLESTREKMIVEVWKK